MTDTLTDIRLYAVIPENTDLSWGCGIAGEIYPTESEAIAGMQPGYVIVTATVGEILGSLNPYVLAGMADCPSPDSTTSSGADFLDRIRTVVVETLGEHRADEGADCDIFEDVASQTTEDATIYTHQLWSTFVDLAGYQEDLTDFEPITDMESGARVCLYLIAERLVGTLADMLEEWEVLA